MPQNLKALLLIGVLGLLTFSNGLANPFLIDDHAFFEEKLRNIKFLPLHFLPDKDRALHIEGESADPFYRPLATVVPMISILIWKNNTIGHHATNLALFCLAGFCIYLFLMRLGAGYPVSLLSAALYIMHPINGVAVNYITASIFSVQVILMLGALYCLLRQDSWPWTAGACVLYILSTWCHETAMFLPFYALILYCVLADGPKRVSLSATLAQAWKKTWPLFAVFGINLFIRVFFVSALQESILSKIQYFQISFAQYLATWTMLLAWYLSKLFWFQHVVLIMAHQPLRDSVAPWIILFLALAALAVFSIWYLRRDKFMLLGLAWFIFGFFPYTMACFFQPVHGLMIEPHWFLFPVIGFFLCFSRVLERLMSGVMSRPPHLAPQKARPSLKWLGRGVLVLFVFFSVYFSRWHNWAWGDEVRYCNYWLMESPSFVAVNAYLAKAYELRKRYDLARAHYAVILKRGYKSYVAYTNMGLMDMEEGKWTSAKENLLKVMDIDPKASVAVNDLGVIYFMDGEYSQALKYFLRAHELNRFTVLPLLDISKAYLKLGDNPKAIDALNQVLDIVPGEEHAMVDLIQIYMADKDQGNVVRMARLMLHKSENPYTLKNAGILLQSYGFSGEAKEAFGRARSIFNSARP